MGYPRAFLSRLHAAVLARDDLLTKDQTFFDDDRLNVSPEPIATAGPGGSISQNFEHLADALDMVRRQSGWKLADLAELDADARHNLNYRFRLDVAQLPRPFQIAAGSQADWSLSLSRNQRISLEAGR